MSGKTPTGRLTPVENAAGRTVYYDEDQRTYHTWCDDDDYEPVSTALLAVVSSVIGTDPVELESLSDRVDPDALNAMVHHWRTGGSDGGGSISFTFSDCGITVLASGEIVIDPNRRQRSFP
ncbi:hypothetical protein EA462_11100 [Natrarchaeobius halalkaliphilus]|uniref:Halobacterial output domain-containing protein n=1 Tax=Natrarchaeobius halalkaliphilus TaxID=1679091 RepID=A0A3N6LJN0_9EURY|nr:HalOD1 output domain-containing protein [Natrarchaeobius halalkaliphilus]RQG88933.1 hypothetical protein EA462_11100 [Natrarchaeobius halalkaliphilus]